MSTVTILTPPTNGATIVNPTTGAVIYTPTPGFTGTDTFTYTVNDNLGATSNIATVTVTVEGGEPGTFTFNPIDDSYVQSTKPTQNFGQEANLKVRTDTVTFVTYLKFNITGMGGTVVSAKLRLLVKNQSTDVGSIFTVSNNLLGTATPWNENNIVWNNAPTVVGTPLSSLGLVVIGAIAEFDVTAGITGNGIVSFAINNNIIDGVTFDSNEGITPPELVIETVANSAAKQVTEEYFVEKEKLIIVLPDDYALSPNYPNPFNAETVIEYALPEDSKVKLKIYNILGQLVRTLIDENEAAGFKQVKWFAKDNNGLDVSSGIYFLRLEANQRRFSRRLILQK